jgi:predicted  nucleic acid-binding Zn-ribbon protein
MGNLLTKEELEIKRGEEKIKIDSETLKILKIIHLYNKLNEEGNVDENISNFESGLEDLTNKIKELKKIRYDKIQKINKETTEWMM